jgi:hypothetical protein
MPKSKKRPEPKKYVLYRYAQTDSVDTPEPFGWEEDGGFIIAGRDHRGLHPIVMRSADGYSAGPRLGPDRGPNRVIAESDSFLALVGQLAEIEMEVAAA